LTDGSTDNRGSTDTTPTTTETPASTGSSTALEAVEKAFAAESVSSTDSPASAGTGASPSASTPAATSPAAATVTPPVESTIPLERHEAALRNAREKAAQELRDKVGWAESYKREQVEQAMQMLAALNRDPKAFSQQLIRELQSTDDPTDPDPDLVSQDGKHRAYSADAVKAIVTNALARFEKKLRPTVEFATKSQEQIQRDAFIRENLGVVQQLVTDARNSYPWLKAATPEQRTQHEQAIAQKITAMDATLKTRLGAAGTFYRALADYYYETILPAEQAQAEQRVNTDNRKKAAASSGTVRSDRGGPTSTKRPTTPEELAAHMAGMVGASDL